MPTDYLSLTTRRHDGPRYRHIIPRRCGLASMYVERCGAVTVDVMAERATCSGGTRATTISRPNAGGEGSTHREGA